MIGNPLVSYLIRHAVAGTLAGWLTVGVLTIADVGGVGTLVLASDLAPVPLLMLLAFFGLTFASAAMGVAIMSLGATEPGRPAAGRLTGALPSARRTSDPTDQVDFSPPSTKPLSAARENSCSRSSAGVWGRP